MKVSKKIYTDEREVYIHTYGTCTTYNIRHELGIVLENVG